PPILAPAPSGQTISSVQTFAPAPATSTSTKRSQLSDDAKSDEEANAEFKLQVEDILESSETSSSDITDSSEAPNKAPPPLPYEEPDEAPPPLPDSEALPPP